MLKVIVHILYLPMHGIISDHQLSALHSKLWILVRFSVWYPLTHSIVNCDSEWSSLFKVFAFGRFGGHFITTSNKQAYYISHLIFLFNSYFFLCFFGSKKVSFQGKGRLAIKKYSIVETKVDASDDASLKQRVKLLPVYLRRNPLDCLRGWFENRKVIWLLSGWKSITWSL